MRLSLHERSRSAFIPLRDAVLCLDCQFITPPGCNTCSVCGGHALLGVAQILGALLEEPPATTPARSFARRSESRLHVIDSDPSRMRRLQSKE
jgi:hypothetical protein